MHYLVTGGCGFIGSHLVDALLAAGHGVTVLDDLSTGKRANIPAPIEMIEGDITAPGIFDGLIGKADGCFHLAAIASVQRSETEPLRTHQVNVSGTVALFDALIRPKKRLPVVFASSAAVYGDCQTLPIQETMPVLPLSSYGVDKLACEFHARIAASVHHIPTIGLRFFNVYGPRQDPHSPYSGVMSIFAERMRQEQPVTIHGDGEQSRDFIHVSDIARGMQASMAALQEGKVQHGIFNLCTGLSTSITRLAERIRAFTGSSSPISHGPPRVGDIRHSLGDEAGAHAALGFSAAVPFADGLADLLKARAHA